MKKKYKMIRPSWDVNIMREEIIELEEITEPEEDSLKQQICEAIERVYPYVDPSRGKEYSDIARKKAVEVFDKILPHGSFLKIDIKDVSEVICKLRKALEDM